MDEKDLRIQQLKKDNKKLKAELEQLKSQPAAGDLINRSVVIDVLKETGIIQDNDLGHLVVNEINRIPIAYNVDKVLEKMEQLKNHYLKCCLVDYNEGAAVATEECMAIVRKNRTISITEQEAQAALEKMKGE